MTVCCAPGCTNARRIGVKMFSIPSGKNDQERRQIWLHNIGGPNFQPNLSMRLCKIHFTEDQFEKNRPDKLKPNAIPTMFSPMSLMGNLDEVAEANDAGNFYEGGEEEAMDQDDDDDDDDEYEDGRSEQENIELEEVLLTSDSVPEFHNLTCEADPVISSVSSHVKRKLLKKVLRAELEMSPSVDIKAEECAESTEILNLFNMSSVEQIEPLPKYWSDLMSNLFKFRDSGFLCDTLMTSKNKKYVAHSILLASVSPVFQMVFHENSTIGLHVVKLSEVEDAAVEIFLHYAYTGKLRMPLEFENADRFSQISAALQDLGLDVKNTLPEFTSDNLNITELGISTEVSSHEEPRSDSSVQTLSESINQLKNYSVPFVVSDLQKVSPNCAMNSRGVATKQVQLNGRGLQRKPMKRRRHPMPPPEQFDSSSPPVLSEVEKLSALIARASSLAAGEMCTVTEQEILAEDHSYIKRTGELESIPVEVPSMHLLASLTNGQNHNLQRSLKRKGSKNWQKSQKILQMVTCYECITCNKKFKSHPQFLNHKRSYEHAHRVKEKSDGTAGEFHRPRKSYLQTVCHLCGKSLKQGSMKGHMESVHDKTAKYECEHCQKTFLRAQYLALHIRKVHYDVDPKRTEAEYACSQCNKTFTNIISWRAHKYNAHANRVKYNKNRPIRDHVCVVCGKKFASKSWLDQHVQVHTDQKPHLCSYCGKAFAMKGSLLQHVIRHPEKDKDKRFSCSVCGKRFFYKFLLHNHELTHNPEKPFHCRMCPKKFKSKQALLLHTNMHTGSRLHVCDLCGFSATKSFNLKRHMLRHSDERPYTCNRCNSAFKDKYDLREHRKRVHKIEYTSEMTDVLNLQ